MRKLEKLAVEVAISAPMKRSRWAPTAYISWDIIEAIRAEMERKGVDWRAGAAAYKVEVDRRKTRKATP